MLTRLFSSLVLFFKLAFFTIGENSILTTGPINFAWVVLAFPLLSYAIGGDPAQQGNIIQCKFLLELKHWKKTVWRPKGRQLRKFRGLFYWKKLMHIVGTR